MKTIYKSDGSLLGKKYAEIQSEWTRIPSTTDNKFRLLDYTYTRWTKDNYQLIAVFDNQAITHYLMYDELNRIWMGTPSESLTARSILSLIAKHEPPDAICDVGSGATINTVFSCDGYIVAWTEDNEALVFNAFTLKQSQHFLLYQLILGILF